MAKTPKPGQEQNEKKKKKGGKKRALSAYMYFANERRAVFRRQHPELTFGQLNKLLGQAWKQLSEDQRQPYIACHSHDKAQYDSQNVKVVKPKRPVTSFVLFSKDYRQRVKDMNPHATFAEVGKLLGEMWKTLPHDIKQQYTSKASQARLAFEKEKPSEGLVLKRPVTSFVLFSQDYRERIKKVHPQASFAEVGRLLGDAWKDLPAGIKKQYTDSADVARAAFEQQKEMRKPKKSAPKRAASPYILFAKENRETIKKLYPNASFAELGKVLGETWKKLTEEAQAPYRARASEDKARFEQEKAVFFADSCTNVHH